MKKIDELLQLFNGVGEKLQTSWDWMESRCFEEIAVEVFHELNEVAGNLKVEEHRWYDTSISVYEVAPNEFLGVRSLTSSKSESQDAENCYVIIEFFEMEEIQITSYKQK